jgi:hypothetical protein
MNTGHSRTGLGGYLRPAWSGLQAPAALKFLRWSRKDETAHDTPTESVTVSHQFRASCQTVKIL